MEENYMTTEPAQMTGRHDSIKSLVDHINMAYRESASDRSRIHQIEWDRNRPDWQLLGEIENRASNILGVASSFTEDRQFRNIQDQQVSLRRSRIIEEPEVLDWLIVNGAEFPFFERYMLLLDLLRRLLLDSVIGDRSGDSDDVD